MSKYTEKIKNTTIVQIITNKRYKNLSNKTIGELFLFFWKSLSNGNITTRSAAIAYNMFLSIFPGIIFLFTLIPYLPIPNLENQVMSLLKELMPDYSYRTFETLIADIISNQRAQLLSFSALITLYFATNGISSFLSAFQSSIFFTKQESWIKKRINSFLLAIIITTLLSIATLLMLFTNFALNLLVKYNIINNNEFLIFLIIMGKWLVVFSMFYVTLLFLYYYGTPKKERKWKFFSVGTIFSTIMIVLVSWGFSYYVNNFGQYNKFYGSLGAIIVLLLWLYFISLTVLVGFEINKSIDAEKI